jgi:hypothetical protein
VLDNTCYVNLQVAEAPFWRCGSSLESASLACSYIFGETDPQGPAAIIARGRGMIYGFATTCPSQDEHRPHAGELMAMAHYVDPIAGAPGVGTALPVPPLRGPSPRLQIM